MAYLHIGHKITGFAKLMDIGGNGEFSTKKNGYGWKWGIFYQEIWIWMDMDLPGRVGVEWVSKFCLTKGSSGRPA